MEITPTNKSLGYYILIWVGHSISSFGSFISNFVMFFFVFNTFGGVTYITLLNYANFLP